MLLDVGMSICQGNAFFYPSHTFRCVQVGFCRGLIIRAWLGGGWGFVVARVWLSEVGGWDRCDGVWDIYSLCKVGMGGGGVSKRVVGCWGEEWRDR